MTQTTDTSSLLRALSNQMADAVERIKPALVLVNGRQRQPASGLVYGPDLVLTADHTLEREEDITIQTYDKRTLPAQFVGRDLGTDLALLRVANLGLASAEAVGGPLRTGRGAILERYIRTDATPYPGFSGGPLVDTQGKVAGILTTGLVNGVALAIPMDIATSIADTLAKQGYIKRGYLGISSQFVELPTTQRAGRDQEHGLLIVKVDDNSPAQQGGILVGDILVALDGHQINDAEELQLLLVGDRVGKEIPIAVIRGNALQTLQVTIGQRK